MIKGLKSKQLKQFKRINKDVEWTAAFGKKPEAFLSQKLKYKSVDEYAAKIKERHQLYQRYDELVRAITVYLYAQLRRLMNMIRIVETS